MLDHYHGRLMTYLATFGYPDNLYPKETFLRDFNDCFVFGFITGTFIAQVRSSLVGGGGIASLRTV